MLQRFCAVALLVAAFASSVFASDAGLIGYWDFDEASGSIIHDRTANNNDGTITDDAGFTINGDFVPGITGTALHLDGSTEIHFGVPSNLSPSSGITVEAWYFGEDFHGSGNDAIVDRPYLFHGLPAYQYHLGVRGTQYYGPGLNGSGFLFAIGNNDVYNTLETDLGFWEPGRWYHLVGTYDGVKQKLYVNGVLVLQQSVGGTIPDYGQQLYFGAHVNIDCHLVGTIDEIRIYDRALTEAEILEHFHFPGGSPQTVIRIEKTHDSFQGQYEEVSIQKFLGSYQFGGFDFLLAYDPTGLAFISAELGADLGPSGCGWEYFTYRHGAEGNCGGPCPSGLIRVVAVADVINGANHPSCFSVPDGGELVKLRFLVTNDRTFEYQYVPVRFVWVDCGDNGISTVSGDTLLISAKVFEFENPDPTSSPDFDITGYDCGSSPHYGGACAECDTSLKYEPVREIYFWNGGVDIVCADSIDDRGDINLNGIAYEIADAVLYTNFFIYGLPALNVLPIPREAQIAASDVNADGIPLTVGDLVYLLRIIVGDALPIAKLSPYGTAATVSFDGVLSTHSSAEIGALAVTFRTSGAVSVHNLCNMRLESAASDGVLRVLVYSGLDDMTRRLEAGTNQLFSVAGNADLLEVQIADYDGNMLDGVIGKSSLPQEFALAQNSPNPFNPTTTIRLYLPTASDWTLDIINVSGQVVKTFAGRNSGYVNVEWDARSMPSGVYFYRASAGDFTQTRKMVLLK
ncbi:MAG: T9SS type A sorting domain-containing protein [candidate division Zixibacteria bacterium]|nr:T9SS type A sorting domain-containing protein [candidate division Zixibacteria bacterium]